MMIAQWIDLDKAPFVSHEFARTRRCALLMAFRLFLKGYREFRRRTCDGQLQPGDSITITTKIKTFY